MNIETLRNLLGALNRRKNGTSEADALRVLNGIMPPVKGEEPNMKDNTYPPQLSGLHEEGKKQQINLSGNTSGSSTSSLI